MNSVTCENPESAQKSDQWTENNLGNGGLIITFKQEKESDASDNEDDQNYLDDDVNDPSKYLESSQTVDNALKNGLQARLSALLSVRIKEEPVEIKTETVLPDVPERQEVAQVNIKQEPDCCCEREFVVCDTGNNTEVVDSKDSIIYRCDTCQNIFDSKSDLKVHVEKCAEELRVKNAVKARFKAKLGLNGFRAPLTLRHLEKEVPEKPPSVHGNCKPLTGKKYSCTLCGASFKCRSNVKVHTMLKHSDDRKFECHICRARFKIKYILKKHINIKHSDVRNFSCAQCDAKFKTKFEVISHTRFKHTNERNFACGTCGAKFKTKGHLQAHESNTHSKVRNFRCDVCSATFKSKTALNRHLKYNSSKLHSNVIVYECKFCSMKFKAELPLKLHIALSHSKDKAGS